MKIRKTIKEWCMEHEVELYGTQDGMLYEPQDVMVDEKKIDLQEFSSFTAKYKSSWKKPYKNGFTMMSCGLISGVWAED